MLLARIRVTNGPHRGAITYARVVQFADGTVDYLPLSDPFETGSSAPTVSGPVPGNDAELLAPCRPRVVLGMAHNTGPADRLLAPQAFHKSPHSVIGPGQHIELVPGQTAVDGEAELAVVIGSRSKNLTPDDALAAVYGYTCANDVTDRAAQGSDSLWTEAKSRDTFTPLGPWIRTDLDPADVPVGLGNDQQAGALASTRGLARSVIEVLVYLSSIMTLHPGDVILTGAPGGSLRLAPGGITRVGIPGVGDLVNPIILRKNASSAKELVGAAHQSNGRTPQR